MTAAIDTFGGKFTATFVVEKKRITLLVVVVICYYIVNRFINKLREWKRRYLLIEALPSPNPKNLWLYHLSDILACPNVKKDKNNPSRKPVKNLWPLFESWCKEMCCKKGHGGFQINVMSPSRLSFASAGAFFAIDYELVKAIVNHPDLKAKGASYDYSKPLIDHSVLIATGHDWKRMRKLTAKAFSHTVMKNTHDTSIRILHDKVFPYFHKKQRNINKPYVDVVDLVGRFTLDVLGSVSFSHDYGGINELISSDCYDSSSETHQCKSDNKNEKLVHQLFSEITEDIQRCNRYRGLYTPKRMNKNVSDLNNVIDTVIDKKIQQQKCNTNDNNSNCNRDLMDYLLERNPKDGTPILTREEIVGNTKVFAFAGHDTTGTTISAMFFELGCSPDVVKKLREEIDPYFDDENGSGCGPTYNDLRGNCDYLNKVVREILRLHPAGLFSRTSATKDVVIKTSKFKYVLPKKTQIIISPCLSQRYSCNINNKSTDDNAKEEEKKEEKQRCEKPYDVFDPDRTIDYDNDVFFPFAIGARNCVGREMAMAEIRVLLAQVVHNYDLVLEPEAIKEGMETYVVLTLRVTNYGMKFVKRKRKEDK